LNGQIIAFDSPQQQYTSYPRYFRDHPSHSTIPASTPLGSVRSEISTSVFI